MRLIVTINGRRLAIVERLAQLSKKRQAMEGGVQIDAISGVGRRRNKVDLLVCIIGRAVGAEQCHSGKSDSPQRITKCHLVDIDEPGHAPAVDDDVLCRRVVEKGCRLSVVDKFDLMIEERRDPIRPPFVDDASAGNPLSRSVDMRGQYISPPSMKGCLVVERVTETVALFQGACDALPLGDSVCSYTNLIVRHRVENVSDIRSQQTFENHEGLVSRYIGSDHLGDRDTRCRELPVPKDSTFELASKIGVTQSDHYLSTRLFQCYVVDPVPQARCKANT